MPRTGSRARKRPEVVVACASAKEGGVRAVPGLLHVREAGGEVARVPATGNMRLHKPHETPKPGNLRVEFHEV